MSDKISENNHSLLKNVLPQNPLLDITLPIGIIDSGVGGLSIAKCISETLPHEHLIYIADSMHAPYGDKSVDFIQQRIISISQHLLNHPVKALVIACNTATVNAIEQLRAIIDIPIIGVEPAIKPAAQLSTNKKVGLLVTQATAENLRFQALIEQHHNGAEIHIQPCLGLVEIIESGDIDTDECHQLLSRYLSPLLDKGVDTLVLGCTHYPLLQHQIKYIVGEQMTIIETAAPVTLQLCKMLAQAELKAPKHQQAKHHFYSSNSSPQQQRLFNQLWQQEVHLNKLPL